MKFRNSVGEYDAFMCFAGLQRLGFDERWDGLFGFFSEHLGMLLELVDSRSKFMGIAERILAHEIGASGVSIRDATGNLRKCFDPLFRSDEVTSTARWLVEELADQHRQGTLRITDATRGYALTNRSTKGGRMY